MEYVDRVKILDSEVKGIGDALFRIAQCSSCNRTREVTDCNVKQQSLVYRAMLNCSLYLKLKKPVRVTY
jgi:hypothetical protein